MNEWYDEDRNGPGGLLLLMGLALGAAAAFLLATRQGQQMREQITRRAGQWTAQAADAIAQGRETLVASVEEQAAPPPPGSPVRERPL